MKIKSATWYECRVRHNRVQENGAVKKVTEVYVVDALSYIEAETRIIEKMRDFYNEDFEIRSLKKAAFKEIFINDDDAMCGSWFKVKLSYFVINEKTGCEKRTAQKYLVEASDIRGAIEKIDEAMKDTMDDYEISSLSDTQIWDVYQYEEKPVCQK